LIRKDLIFLGVDLESKDSLFEYISKKLYEKNLITDVNEYVKVLKIREAEYPTSIGYEIAIPHGKSDCVVEPFIVYLKLNNPILWDQESNSNVNSIFMIGVNNDNGSNIHLLYLSNIARALMDDEFREQLRISETLEDTFNLLNEINHKLEEEKVV